MIPTNRPPTHPGEMLQEEFLIPMGINQSELARRIGDRTPKRINEIINGKRGVTAEMALRLSRVFDNSPEFWMNLQNAVDLYDAREAMVRAAAR
jgi:addiction module HigA family antidote